MAKKARACDTLKKLKEEIQKWLRHRSELGFEITRKDTEVKISLGLARKTAQNPSLTSAQIGEIQDFLQMIKQKFCLIVQNFVNTGLQLQLSFTLA